MYKGKEASIPLGQLGMYRDDSAGKIPIGSLYDSRNVTLNLGMVQTAFGNQRMNVSAVPGGVKSATWWEADPVTKRFVMGGGDGRVYYYEYPRHQGPITPEVGAVDQLLIDQNTHFLTCGSEAAGSPRKIFIITGQSEVQVITGAGKTRRPIPANKVALDWSGKNQPSYGISFGGRAILFGNPNNPHMLYISSESDNEDFQSNSSENLNVFPGEGQGLLTAFQYKGRLWLVKKPYGLYYVDTSNSDVTQWTIQKSVASLTCASSHSIYEVLDDAIIANNAGSLTSLQATLNFGSVANADLFSNMKVRTYQQIFCSQSGNSTRWIYFYEYRQEIMITYRDIASNQLNDQLCVIDVSNPSIPKVLWHDRIQANALGEYLDNQDIRRPFYACDDGFIYNYDVTKDANVNGSPYTAYFTLPPLDFGFIDPNLAEKNKIFQFLEVTYEPSGTWDLQCDVFIDGSYSETIQFNMSYGPVLDKFTLDIDRLSGRTPRSQRKQIHGQGRNISFKFYMDQYNQYFKVAKIKVSFKVSGESQKGADK